MKLLVTGGSGFIGTNFIRYWLDKYTDDIIVNVDVMTYAAVETNHIDTANKYIGRYYFEKASICDYYSIQEIVRKYEIDTIVNFAAESHNSYAIINPTVFYQTNLMGTQTLLEITRKENIKRFHHISTCEVFGSLNIDSDGIFTEDSPLLPNSPYNSSKACSDLTVRAYYKTYCLPITSSSCSNNYGPYQFIEKMIPLFVTNLIQNKPLTLYKETQNKREWLYVEDHCEAIDRILINGKVGESYNIGSGCEKSIKEIADYLLTRFNKDESYITYIESRPSHDARYLLDHTKIKNELNWEPRTSFDVGIEKTVDWYIKNEQWWRPLLGRNIIDESKWSNIK